VKPAFTISLLTLTISVCVIFFQLQQKNETTHLIGNSEKNTIEQQQIPRNIAINNAATASSTEKDNYQQALATLNNSTTNGDSTLQAQAEQVRQLAKKYPNSISAKAEQDIAIKIALENLKEKKQTLPITEQLTALEELLKAYTPKQLTELQRYHYAEKYLQTLEKQQARNSDNYRLAANRFLSGDNQQRVLTSIEKMEEQQSQRQAYQTAFEALLLELDKERETSQQHLTESEWRTHQQQKIKQFRLDFFKKLPSQ
jgi:hypothetical protein